MALISCCACQREVPDRLEICPYCGAEPIKVRSLLTVVVVAAVGLVLGILAAVVYGAIRRQNGAAVGPVSELLLAGACWGALSGAAAGALFWAFFPYKGLQRRPEPDTQPVEAAESL